MSDVDRLYNVCLSLLKVQTYIKGFSFDDLRSNSLRREAVMYNLYVLGYELSSLSQNVKNRYPDFPYLYAEIGFGSGFSIEDMESLLYSESREENLLSHVRYFRCMYESELELVNKEVDEYQLPAGMQPTGSSNAIRDARDKESLIFDNADYKYPTRSKNSVWTVKKK